MKPFDLNTPFTFGKYEGKTLGEVFDTDPTYVDKCLASVDEFSIEEKSLQQLFEKYPDFEMSDAAIDANLDKLDATGDIDVDDDLIFGEEAYDDDLEDLDGFSPKGKNKGDDWDAEEDDEGWDDEDADWKDPLEEEDY